MQFESKRLKPQKSFPFGSWFAQSYSRLRPGWQRRDRLHTTLWPMSHTSLTGKPKFFNLFSQDSSMRVTTSSRELVQCSCLVLGNPLCVRLLVAKQVINCTVFVHYQLVCPLLTLSCSTPFAWRPSLSSLQPPLCSLFSRALVSPETWSPVHHYLGVLVTEDAGRADRRRG